MSRQEPRQKHDIQKSPFGSNLKVAQAEAEKSNETLAYELGVTVRLIQKWRAGTVTPRWENTVRLGVALDREPGWFYSEPDEVAA